MNNTKFRLGAIIMIALVSTIIGTGVTPILLPQSVTNDELATLRII
jgi:hypothetical protein